ncbi:MAG: FG-GAP repeat protein, partial [Candidatus Thermoplasmatota archaeon]|nr:FG-GAP repeat protein [Candidatus Thermoplasmatota archaeon]
DGEELGFSLAAGGDINRDHFANLIVGAPFADAGGLADSGRVYVYYGGSPMNDIDDKNFSGEAAEDNFGWAVAGNVSVDRDTSMDIVVGAPNHKVGGVMTGAAYVIRNVIKVNPAISVVNGKAAGDGFGFSVAALVDMNGDAYGDIAIGAPFNDDNGTDAGEVSVLYGSSKFNINVELAMMGQGANEHLGWALAAGDFHEDGYTDLLVGAPDSDLNTTSTGRAYAYFGGQTPDAYSDLVLVPDAGADFFGGSVAVGGNITGDSAPDFAVGDPQFTPSGLANAGRAYIYAGLLIEIPVNPIVEGFVLVPGTTTGISGFTVTLEPAGWSTTTAANGYFQIKAVPGTYWLNASKTGYVSNSTDVSLAMNDEKIFVFYPLTVPLVEGLVTDIVSMAPIAGATVSIFNGTSFMDSTTTLANGTYSLYLPEAFVPEEHASIGITVYAWDSAHYTGNSSKNLARNQTARADFTLDRFPVISGTVRTAITLSPVRDAVVQAVQGASILASTISAGNGQYSLAAVNATAGSVFVNVTASGYWRESALPDVDKNVTYTQDFFLQIDHVPPSSQLVMLTKYTNTSVVTVTANATDLNGIAEVQLWYRYNGTGSFEFYSADTTSPYVFSFDTAALDGDGLYEFYAQAVDYAGNNETAPAGNETWTIVDSAPPVSSVEPLPEYTLTENFNITEIVSDAGGIYYITLYYRLNGGTYIPLWVNSTAAYQETLNSAQLGGDGSYDFYTVAVDVAGNVESVPSVPDTTTFVDTQAPNVTIVAPTPNKVIGQTSITINWTGYDTGSGVKGYMIRVDGGAWADVGMNLSYNYTNLAFGSHTVSVNVSDMAGHWGIATVSVLVDTRQPELIITTPTADEVIEHENVTVTWITTDLESGIARIQVSLDHGAFYDVAIGNSTVLTYLKNGLHDVTVRTTDGVGNYRDVTVSFTVQLEKEQGGGISALTIGAIAIVTIALIVAALMILRRKKPTQTPGPDKEQTKKT